MESVVEQLVLGNSVGFGGDDELSLSQEAGFTASGGGCLKIVKPTVGRAFWWFCTLIEGLELFFVTIYIVSPSMKELIKPVSAFVVVLVILEALFVALIISVHDERRQVLRLQKEREKILAESGGSNGDNYLWCSRGCTDICFMRNAATMMCGDRTIWSVVNEEEVLG